MSPGGNNGARSGGNADAKSLLIAGGGTGGHVFPALAVAQEWLRRSSQGAEGRSVVFVGTERGIETKLVPQAGFPLELPDGTRRETWPRVRDFHTAPTPRRVSGLA